MSTEPPGAWAPQAATTGTRSRVVLAVTALTSGAWLTWPIWRSASSPDMVTQSALAPWILAAFLGLLTLLGAALWLDSGRRLDALAPVSGLVALAVGVRLLLHPGSNGIEPVFVVPLLAGILLGSPAGFLTGAMAACLSAVTLDQVGGLLPGQMVVWALWGLVGGWLRPLPTRWAWLAAVPLCVVLGLVSGVAFNLTGWSQDTAAEAGRFLPGLTPTEALLRIWDYSLATSFWIDLARGVTCALVVAIVGLPVLRALRRTFDSRTPATALTVPQATLTAHALDRRARSRRLAHLWTPDEGDPQ